MKKLVLLTCDDLPQRYIVNRLVERFAFEAVIVDVRPRASLIRRARRYKVPVLFSKFLRLFYLGLIHDDRQARLAMERVLGKNHVEEFARKDLVREVRGVNSRACAEVLGRIAPDAILVFGTSIVRDRILELAADVAFNMHTGISPIYRGSDCTFWPIYNRELHMVGATVHECTSAIDGGRIFKTCRAELEPEDQMHDVFARAIKAGAELYIEAVGDYLEDRLQGEPQDLSKGVEYRAAMRTLGAELRVRRLIRRGLIREHAIEDRPSSPRG